ncbi:hypothetical protein [Flagellimonas crocea]|uniref:hypothetical protein n=1 Tax=Flagellimonas crocea TaxID=3067311 RepID=UPI00296F4AF3|nr:hypothetical protein [Muricauda sp. DH64]
MKLQATIFLTLTCVSFSFGQVLNTSDSNVQAALGNGGMVEGSPLSNYFQRRNPAMDQLMREVRNNGTTQKFYIGPEKGSAYEEEDFVLGKVFTEEEFLDNVYFRYNAFSDELEVKKTQLEEEAYQALIKNEDIYIVSNTGEKYIYRDFYNEDGDLERGYLKILSETDSATLYKQYTVKYFEGKEAQNSMVNPIPSRFTPFTGYYLKTNSTERILELPSKKRKLFKFLEENIGGFDSKNLSKNDLDLDSEQDVLIFFNNIVL